MKLCLDTNIFIAIKNREKGHELLERILDAVDDGRAEGVVSSIVMAEVLVGFYMNGETTEAERFKNHLLLRYHIQPVTFDIADMAAKIRASGTRLPDAIIIASAILTESTLVTLDEELRHPNLDVKRPEEIVDLI